MKSHVFLFAVLLVSCQNQKTDNQPGHSHWLTGSWSAKAFAGRLDEYWTMDSRNGLMLKAGYYIEDSDTSYSEILKMDSLGESVFMIAKPFNADARIYALKKQTQDSLVFENPVYRNPFKIVYTRTDDKHFTRLITGIEDGDTVRIRFEFERMK